MLDHFYQLSFHENLTDKLVRLISKAQFPQSLKIITVISLGTLFDEAHIMPSCSMQPYAATNCHAVD